ncbi:MAG: hypothetical protein HC844_06275 [Tabrizicola sp.]|nr:hypothetical protein [Tabrizicola sp.]
MLLKIILVFLGAMVLLGMIGKALFPGAMPRITRRRKAAVCADCGRPIVGRGACDCGGKG